MKIVKVNRYRCECGRGFWNKNSCEEHEKNCKSWKNPKHKTCLSCKHHTKSFEAGWDDEGDWQYGAGYVNECAVGALEEGKYTPAHEKAPDIAKNCLQWESKKKF